MTDSLAIKTWKHHGPATAKRFQVDMPFGAEVIEMLQLDEYGSLDFWFWFHERNQEQLHPRTFQLVGTGHPLVFAPTETVEHIASTIVGIFVFHLYEIHGVA